MAAALTIVPDEEIVAAKTVCHIYVTGADDNRPPNETGGEFTYRIRGRFDDGGVDDLVSHAFAPSSDGKHQWDDVIFPTAGSWTLTLRDTSDDSQEATLAVEVE